MQVPASSAVCSYQKAGGLLCDGGSDTDWADPNRDVTLADCVLFYFYFRPHLKHPLSHIFPLLCISPTLSSFQSVDLCHWQPPAPLLSSPLLSESLVKLPGYDRQEEFWELARSLARSLTLPSDCNRSEALASTKQLSALKPLFIMWRGRPPSHAFTGGNVGCQQVALCQMRRCDSLWLVVFVRLRVSVVRQL